MSLVVDSSVALAWIYDDAATPATVGVLETVCRNGAWVPSIWHLEVANVLEMSVRRGRITGAFRDAALADLALLPIQADLETQERAWSDTARLAASHRLTLYDAAYLELAKRLAAPIATLDRDLAGAAEAEGVLLVIPRP